MSKSLQIVGLLVDRVMAATREAEQGHREADELHAVVKEMRDTYGNIMKEKLVAADKRLRENERVFESVNALLIEIRDCLANGRRKKPNLISRIDAAIVDTNLIPF